jgi:uncharacterized damage-inducible protein DinB
MGLSEATSARLVTQLEPLARLFTGVGEDAMRRRPTSGKWSAHENLAHLARYHEIFIERLCRMLTEDRPQLGRYRSEDDPEAARWMAMSVGETLSQLKTLRSRLVGMVENLSPEQVERTGIHPVLGEMTIPLWIEFFLLHEAHHLYIALMQSRGGG